MVAATRPIEDVIGQEAGSGIGDIWSDDNVPAEGSPASSHPPSESAINTAPPPLRRGERVRKPWEGLLCTQPSLSAPPLTIDCVSVPTLTDDSGRQAQSDLRFLLTRLTPYLSAHQYNYGGISH
ncbi:hypothetical protein OUZ56_011861 [Daphnia magna]|uniref:Uncharacterized protein n=1 Tax=Daphnia magna TaxID=35525 RepID=A0ABQ9Z1C6_9CRUS|nr:hypothetical protein OUZ56_011861 [Daphnia magna]